MAAVKERRVRLSAEEAKRRILDVAERRLSEVGPEGIRLQDVAAELGISHPAILHHFGSREGLLQAVVDRAMRALETDLLDALQRAGSDAPDGIAMVNRAFEMLATRGHGRLLAWLALSGHEGIDLAAARSNWRRISDTVHAVRVANAGPEPPSYEDTVFTLVLAALTLFGEAIAGKPTLDMAGFGADPDAERRFREWLAGLLAQRFGG